MDSRIQEALSALHDARIPYARMMDDERPLNVVKPIQIRGWQETTNGRWANQLLAQPDVAPLTQEELNMERERRLVAPFRVPSPEVERRPGYKPKGWLTPVVPINRDNTFFQNENAELSALMVEGNKQGWALKFLIADEVESGNNRYLDYERSYREAPIPPLRFQPNLRTVEYLHYLLSQITDLWALSETHLFASLNFLADWLLWGLGHPSVPHFPDERNYAPGEVDDFTSLDAHLGKRGWDGLAHNRLFQTLDFKYFLLWPYDHFGELLGSMSLYEIPAFEKIDNFFAEGFFKGDSHEQEDLVFDPQTGTGRYLLAASNFTRNLVGSETELLLAKFAILNGYLYAPEMIWPNPDTVERDFLVEDGHAAACAIIRVASLMQTKGLWVSYFQTTQVTDDSHHYAPIELRYESKDYPFAPQEPEMELSSSERGALTSAGEEESNSWIMTPALENPGLTGVAQGFVLEPSPEESAFIIEPVDTFLLEGGAIDDGFIMSPSDEPIVLMPSATEHEVVVDESDTLPMKQIWALPPEE